VALAELSRRELKGWSGCSRRSKEVGEPRVGRGVRLFPYPPTSFEVEQTGLPRDLDPRTGDGLLI